ncbi:hypothetical protein DNTS_019008 [Danionella cerebrum]|uniref:UBX domain-containing protein 4 n=1 Tax=Danionella cerebrum TaxID=2873325 RepID=A0A553RJK0_9TELE|nr:hypothetical protein DNTS_019008 [Danionella translucida]
MRWFEGSIPAAIAAAKQRKCVFVVVITGNDDLSRQLIASWETSTVSEVAQNCCVAIQVDAASETCVQFSQIYPVVCVPSSFFIGENGVPLEVIAGSVNEEELKNRISRVTEMHAQQCVQLKSEMLVSETQSSSSSTSKESPSVTTEEAGGSGHVTPGEKGEVSGHVTSGDDASQPQEALDAKVERINKKLEERREQKKKEEEEKLLQKEVERRKVGKEMQEYKKKQEDQKMKQLLEEREKEREEERAARERVKQQIALDRADRAARAAQNQKILEESKREEAQAQTQRAEEQRERAAPQRSAVCRLQFRLPDGSSFSAQFPSGSTLREVHSYAAQELSGRWSHFSLSTMFPRREFSSADLERTLQDLELAPSAALILLPQSSHSSTTVLSSSSSSSGLWALFGSLLFPLLAVWRVISRFLFSTDTQTPRPDGGQTSSQPSASGSEPPRDLAVRRRAGGGFQNDGNIHRLRSTQSDPEDNNTWNGNSTQQITHLKHEDLVDRPRRDRGNCDESVIAFDFSIMSDTAGAQTRGAEVDRQMKEAAIELQRLKSLIESADMERSRLLLEKSESEAEKKKSEAELQTQMEQEEKLSDLFKQEMQEIQDEKRALEEENHALMRELNDLQQKLRIKRNETDSLQQRFKIQVKLPPQTLKFTSSLSSSEKDEAADEVSSVFTVTQTPSVRLYGGQAIITFEEEKVAQQILSLAKCSVTCDAAKIEVKPQHLSLEPSVQFQIHLGVSRRTVNFLRVPVNVCVPDECVKDRLELSFSKPSLGGGEVESMEMRVDNKSTKMEDRSVSGRVTFLSSAVAENLIGQGMFSVSLDKERAREIEIQPEYKFSLRKFQSFCGRPKRSLLLSNIPPLMDPEDLQDHLEIYFQKPSNYGGEVEHITYVCQGTERTAFFSSDTPNTPEGQ